MILSIDLRVEWQRLVACEVNEGKQRKQLLWRHLLLYCVIISTSYYYWFVDSAISCGEKSRKKPLCFKLSFPLFTGTAYLYSIYIRNLTEEFQYHWILRRRGYLGKNRVFETQWNMTTNYLKFYVSNFHISFMGKWDSQVDTSGGYPILYIKFYSEKKNQVGTRSTSNSFKICAKSCDQTY